MSPTAEKTEDAAPEATEEPKRGRGRPKSTKRPAEEKVVAEEKDEDAPKEKRGRGRPKGSKKPPKPKYDGPKRGRGRPPKA